MKLFEMKQMKRIDISREEMIEALANGSNLVVSKDGEGMAIALHCSNGKIYLIDYATGGELIYRF